MKNYLTILLAACIAVPSTAQDQPGEPRTFEYDVVPGNAMVAIAIRDLSEFKDRMIALSKQTDGRVSSMLSLAASMGPSVIRDYLGFGQSLDESGSAAIVGYGVGERFALIMPITSTADAAAAFNVNQDDLASGKLIKYTKNQWGDSGFWLGLRGKHLVLGNQDAVAKSVKGGLLTKNIDKKTQSVFAADDVFVTLDFVKMRKLIEEGEIRRDVGVLTLVPRPIFSLANEGELNRFCFGLSLKQGFDGTMLFDFEGDESRRILTKLQNESNKSNLAGLPTGQVVVATSRSSGPESGELIGEAAEYFTSELSNLLGLRTLIAPQQAIGLTSFLDEGINRASVSRAAIYRNEDPQQQGAFCLIGILDLADAEEFIDELRDLVPIFNASLHPDAELDERINEKVIIKMVSFLSHDNQRAREFMTAKLRMVGRHALSALRDAAKSDDAKVRGRAEKLIGEIESDLSRERAEFLSGRITKQLQPDFSYIVDLEKRDGQAIDAIRLELAEKDNQVAPQLRTLLGPDWSNVRLARVGDQVIVMMGSNTSLLDKTIQNLHDGSLGVGDDFCAEFRQQLPGDLMSELHFSMADAIALMGNAKAQKIEPKDKGTTSLGLSITPQQIRFDFLIPVSEFNALITIWD